MVTRWRRSAGIACLTAILAAAAGCSGDPRDEDVKRLLASWERAEPVPLFSVLHDEPLSIDQAYKLQTRAVRDRLGGESPPGFKAGLTSAAQQQRFAMTEPVVGVLWPGTGLDAGDAAAVIDRQRLRQPMIEVELGFWLARPIREPLADLAAVRAAVSHVAPALELPEMNFMPGSLQGSDIIAANTAAGYYVLGQGLPLAAVDVNGITAVLSLDGDRLQQAEASAVMGDQWLALQWMINRLVTNGWILQPGQILLTGAMAAMLPLQQGHYVADFGELGTLELQVK